MTHTASRASAQPHPTGQAEASCFGRDPEIWFPLAGQQGEAVAICRTCPLREPCLEYALAYDVHGVWAGTTRPEREAMRRRIGTWPLPVLMHKDPRPTPSPRKGVAS
jgi:WhiB family redox-sensing transcriptional regulator